MLTPYFKIFATMVIVIGLFTCAVDSYASDLPSVQDRVQEQLKEPMPESANEVSLCEKNIKKYEKKVQKYNEKYDSPGWKLRYYTNKLDYWQRYCAGVK